MEACLFGLECGAECLMERTFLPLFYYNRLGIYYLLNFQDDYFSFPNFNRIISYQR